MATWVWIVTVTVWVLFMVALVWLIQHLYEQGGALRRRGSLYGEIEPHACGSSVQRQVWKSAGARQQASQPLENSC